MVVERLEGAHIVVTGGAGFLGSHLCARLVASGAQVTCIDNFITGRAANVEHLVGHEGFRLVKYDVTDYLHVPGPVDAILHLASPASPVDYLEYPIQTLKVGALGTHKALGMARAHRATFLLASTSEVYGDPQVHPQPETYHGNVDPIGPRGVYDEAKRFAEALTTAYHRSHGVDVRIARIFNVYGESMRLDDGRAVPTFIAQALRGEPLTVYGDGSQTRCFCHVRDAVDGLIALIEQPAAYGKVFNLGRPEEVSIRRLAERVIALTGSASTIRHVPYQEAYGDGFEDTMRRVPDISRARELIGFAPRLGLDDIIRSVVQDRLVRGDTARVGAPVRLAVQPSGTESGYVA